MQYGNSKNPIITAIGLFGLNRTMQYGNPDYDFNAFLGHSRFKSYYVVWKLLSIAVGAKTISGLNRTMQYGNFSMGLSVDKAFNV